MEILFSSRARSTPTCAIPRAAPPERARPMRGQILIFHLSFDICYLPFQQPEPLRIRVRYGASRSVSEPRAVATGSYAQLSINTYFVSYCLVRSLPLAVLTRFVATLTFNTSWPFAHSPSPRSLDRIWQVSKV